MSGIGLLLLGAGATGQLAATATPPESAAAGSSAPFSTPAVTVIVTGGSGSYTYAWSSDISLVVNSPTAATTSFRFTSVAHGDVAESTATCVVTDTITGITASVDVSCLYYRF